MAILAGLMFILGTQRLHFIWAIFCMAVFVYAGGFYVVSRASGPESAQFWWKIEYIGTILIPFIFFHFVLEFIRRTRVWLIASLYTVGLTFVYLNLTTNLVINQVTFKFGELYFNSPPGLLHPYLIVVYVALILVAHYLLFITYRSGKDFAFRARARYLFMATGIGFIGGSMNFFPVYGIDIHPATNLTVIVGSAFVALAILRYKLFNIRVVTAQFLTLILAAFALVQLVVSASTQEMIFNLLLLVITLFVGVYLILSVRKEVEQREKIEKLAGELEKTNKQLEMANERLKELDQLKSEFVSLATHQIRGPLTAIKGYASMLLEGDFGAIPSEVKKPVETILQSSSSLAGIVQDFLDVSRIEQGKMKYEFTVFDLSELVQRVGEELTPNIEQRGLRLKLEVEPHVMVHADVGKIKQVIENLLDNAHKYTPNGSITVRVTTLEGKARLEIKDTGVGIKPEVLPKLFQKFSRAEDASMANLHGTGLGLYVARQLIEAQNGKVWAESEGEGNGSTFVVEVPLK